MEKIKKQLKILKKEICKLKDNEKVEVLNNIKKELHEISPFKEEPVDCVLWVKNDIQKP